jgi:ketosteroid isomerase-like protein
VRHPNADLLAAQIEALARGDIVAAMSFYTDDVVFHYPGRNPLSGDYSGKREGLGLLSNVMQLTNGSFRPEVHDILASDDHVAALVTVRAERDGKPVEWLSVDLFHVRDGTLSEHWVHEVIRTWSTSSGRLSDLRSGEPPSLGRRLGTPSLGAPS